MILATGLLALNAQSLQTKEAPVLDQPKNVQEQPMVAHNLEPKQEVLQPIQNDPTRDPIAQSDAHKLEAAKQRLDVAANVQKNCYNSRYT